MATSLSLAVGLLTTALSLLTFVQQHPELPQSSRDNAQQMAQSAIAQATSIISNPTANTATTSNEAAELELKLDKISKTSNSAQISWITNFPASSKIEVTKKPAASNTSTSQFLPSANGVSTKGLVSVVGLEENTEYQYSIEATVSSGLVKLEGNFMTEKSAETIAQEASAVIENQKAKRRAVIYAEIEKIGCKQMGCSISLDALQRFNTLNKEYYELGGASIFGCSFDVRGGKAVCTGIGG